MTAEETYNDISAYLTHLVQKPGVGANNIVFYIVGSPNQLPRSIPKLIVWHVSSAHTGGNIFSTLKNLYRTTNESKEKNTSGQYLYVHERVNLHPQI